MFNDKQIYAIKNIFNEFHENKNRVKYEDIKIFSDNQENIYISYIGKYLSDDGEVIGDFYLKINNNAEIEKLNYSHDKPYLIELFKTLKQINL